MAELYQFGFDQLHLLKHFRKKHHEFLIRNYNGPAIVSCHGCHVPSRLYCALEDADSFVLPAGLLKPHIHFLSGCLAVLEVDEHISFNKVLR